MRKKWKLTKKIQEFLKSRFKKKVGEKAKKEIT